jgi:hypothetical protein
MKFRTERTDRNTVVYSWYTAMLFKLAQRLHNHAGRLSSGHLTGR